MTYKRESAIEKHLRTQVEKHGGLCYKWVSPGNPGVPDRIVIFKGIIFFVETKAPTGKLRQAQKIQRKKLDKIDADVFVLRTKEQVALWVELTASLAEKFNA